MTILIPETIDQNGIEFLKKRGYNIRFGRGLDIRTLKEDLRGCEGVVMRTARMHREVLLSAVSLKVIGKHGVGVDSIDLDAARELGIRVVNTPGANANSVAEHAFMMMLALARRLSYLYGRYKDGDYAAKDTVKAVEMTGKTLGLVGVGRIGRIVAEKAAGFGMQVIAYDPFAAADSLPEYIKFTACLGNILKQSDFVSLHLPLNDSTRFSFAEKEFAEMKKGAFLINCARGGIVDQDALVEALKSHLGGAGLDVTEPEPLPPGHPLFMLENVIITPHSGAASEEALKRMAMEACAGVDDVLRGAVPKYSVV